MVNTNLRNKEKAELAAIKAYIDNTVVSETNEAYRIDFINLTDDTLPTTNLTNGEQGLIIETNVVKLAKYDLATTTWTKTAVGVSATYYTRPGVLVWDATLTTPAYTADYEDTFLVFRLTSNNLIDILLEDDMVDFILDAQTYAVKQVFGVDI